MKSTLNKMAYVYVALLLIALESSLHVYAAGLSASQVLDRFAYEFRNAKSITARYDITVNGEKDNGFICFTADKFKLNSNKLVIWYNGVTLWSYVPETNEVSISEPTPEELQEINPFVMVSAFRNSYKSVMLKSDSKSSYTIRLTPISNVECSVSSAVITFSAASFMPESMDIVMNGGVRLKLHISSISRGINYPPSTFVFNKNDYPKVEIIDLR